MRTEKKEGGGRKRCVDPDSNKKAAALGSSGVWGPRAPSTPMPGRSITGYMPWEKRKIRATFLRQGHEPVTSAQATVVRKIPREFHPASGLADLNREKKWWSYPRQSRWSPTCMHIGKIFDLAKLKKKEKKREKGAPA